MTYEELIHNPNYEKLDVFSHKSMRHVLMKESGDGGVWSRVSNMYQVLSTLAFIMGGVKAFIPFIKKGDLENLMTLSLGVLFSATLLIVFHELIHAAAYRFVGAKNLSFKAYPKKFIFYVLADKQVLSFKQFRIVALAPVVSVAIIAFLGMVFSYNQPMFYFYLSIFSVHSLFCGGDFGMLSYFENRKGKDILTFDIKEEGKTYFYAKKEEEGSE